MSKLFKLKKFFTIEEAARYLSSMLEENVSETDIYGFALERHLILSVKFNSLIEMSPGYEFADSDLPYSADDSNSFVNRFGHRVFFEDGVMIGEGIWDLSMLGGEFIEIDTLHKTATDEGTWERPRIDAVVLKKNSIFCKLKCLESNINEAPHVLPEGEIRDLAEKRIDCPTLGYYSHKIGIRKEELNRFISLLDDEPPTPQHDEPPAPQHDQKSLGSKERTTLLRLIRSLCKAQGIDLTVRGIVKKLEWVTDNAEDTLSDETLRGIIKKINNLNC
ncbi:hypothetical protein [Vibrio sp. PNB22_8_1]|uniref:hypothetical protein n=1 Tax=unclassified Vibrio TaxID=2614977 RepID=UPI00406A7295